MFIYDALTLAGTGGGPGTCFPPCSSRPGVSILAQEPELMAGIFPLCELKSSWRVKRELEGVQ